MYTIDELKEQNQDISDLCDVLSVLVAHNELHCNPYVCELMDRFKEKVWMHLVFEDNTIYAELSRHPDQNISDIAKNFHDSAKVIKKQFAGYIRSWCKPDSDREELDKLREETQHIISQVMARTEYENTRIFPLIQDMTENNS